MKGKRILSLAMSLVMAVSLAAPALAAEGASPTPLYGDAEVEAYRAAHPGELEALTTEMLLEGQGYQDRTPMERYMEDYGLDSEEEARASLLGTYVRYREMAAQDQEQAEAYRAEDPASWENFDPDAFFAENLDYCDSKEEYMTSWYLLTREEFEDSMYVMYMDDRAYYDGAEDDWGSPSISGGGFSLVANGVYIGSEADGTVRLEGGVSYASAETLNAVLGTSLTGEELPIRRCAEEAGWDVAWNAGNGQAVLLDRERLLTGVITPYGWTEEDLSGLDRLMERLLAAAGTEAGQSYRTTETCDITFTAFNSIDGDKTYTARVNAEVLARDNVWQVTLTANAAQLLELFSEEVRQALAAEMPKASFQDLKTMLSGLKAEIIWNGDEGTMYVNAPFLSVFDDSITENTWFSFDAPVVMPGTGITWNTAEMLYESLLSDSESAWLGAEYAYTDWVNQKAAVYTLFGPRAVTEKGGTITWKLDAGTVGAALSTALGSEDVTAEMAEKLFKEFDLTLSVDGGGAVSADVTIRPDMDAAAWLAMGDPVSYDAGETALMTWIMNLLDFRLDAHSSGTADQAVGTMEFHWKNQFKLELKSQAARKKTGDVPALQPPETAEILPV